jgi:hypothetical protein
MWVEDLEPSREFVKNDANGFCAWILEDHLLSRRVVQSLLGHNHSDQTDQHRWSIGNAFHFEGNT